MSESPVNNEAPPTPEARALIALDRFAQAAIEQIQSELEREFGPAGLGHEYHNLAHTQRAAGLYEKFASLTQRYKLVDQTEVLAGRLAIWFHDSVMRAEIITDSKKGDVGARARAIGDNERNSFVKLASRLDEFLAYEKGHSDDELYLEALRNLIGRVKVIAEEAIMATEPKFAFEEITLEELSSQTSVVPDALRQRLFGHLLAAPPAGDPRFLKISQKNLQADSSMTAFNVAAADLSQVGEMTPEEFAKSGDSELWESKPYIKAAYTNFDAITDPTALTKLAIQTLNWIDTQPGFVFWQWQQASDYLRANSKRFAEQIKAQGHDVGIVIHEFQALLPNFEKNLVASLDRAHEMRSQFGDLTGPDAFSGEQAHANRERLLTLIGLTNPARV